MKVISGIDDDVKEILINYCKVRNITQVEVVNRTLAKLLHELDETELNLIKRLTLSPKAVEKFMSSYTKDKL